MIQEAYDTSDEQGITMDIDDNMLMNDAHGGYNLRDYDDHGDNGGTFSSSRSFGNSSEWSMGQDSKDSKGTGRGRK